MEAEAVGREPSMKMILGSPMQLIATDRRRFMPPENEPAFLSRTP